MVQVPVKLRRMVPKGTNPFIFGVEVSPWLSEADHQKGVGGEAPPFLMGFWMPGGRFDPPPPNIRLFFVFIFRHNSARHNFTDFRILPAEGFSDIRP